MYGIIIENPRKNLIKFIKDDAELVSCKELPEGSYYYEINHTTNQLQALTIPQFEIQIQLYELQGFKIISLTNQRLNQIPVERIVLENINSILSFLDVMGMATGYLQKPNEIVIYKVNFQRSGNVYIPEAA